MDALPVLDAGARLLAGRSPWYGDWVRRRAADDPFWANMQLRDVLDRVEVPVLLHTGWQDLFLDQTLEQYECLRERGVDVALTVGPWTHFGIGTHGTARVTRETLDWLGEHLAGTERRTRRTPVRIYVTGAREWHEVHDWPPATNDAVLHPHPGGALRHGAPAPGTAPVAFTYDPADPTPTVGGRLLAPSGGYRDDRRLAGRGDMLCFTGEPLATPMEVHGNPVVELAHASDNPNADLFVRISEVDGNGRSRNVSDCFVRLDPAGTERVVRLVLDAIAHRFATGHRIRLLVAGGSHPRWERNLGTGDDPATSDRLAPSHRTIDLTASRVVLPVRA
jgi:putative CocE/NonD family hydrolase